jgi:hypothetical protein
VVARLSFPPIATAATMQSNSKPRRLPACLNSCTSHELRLASLAACKACKALAASFDGPTLDLTLAESSFDPLLEFFECLQRRHHCRGVVLSGQLDSAAQASDFATCHSAARRSSFRTVSTSKEYVDLTLVRAIYRHDMAISSARSKYSDNGAFHDWSELSCLNALLVCGAALAPHPPPRMTTLVARQRFVLVDMKSGRSL